MHDEEMLYAEKLSLKQRQISMDRTVQEEESVMIEMEALPDPDDLCVRIVGDDYNDESVTERDLQRSQNRRKMYLWISLVVVLLIVVIAPSAAIANRKSTAQAIGGDDTTTSDDTDSGPQIPTDWDFSTQPFSTLDPTTKLYNFIRPAESSPSARLDPLRLEQETSSTQRESNGRPLPTSAWYQNLLMLGEQEEPSATHRAYAMPYVVDVTGNIPGLRIHTFQKVTTYNTVNLNINEPHALTLGAALDLRQQQSIQQLFGAPKGYSVQAATQLGVSLKWDYFPMTSSIVKGMPYATMEYAPRLDRNEADLDILPTIYSEVQLFGAMAVDGVTSVNCKGDLEFGVEREAQLLFQSGITWMVFFSRPTKLQCKNDGGRFLLQVVENFNIKDPLVIRVAMVVPRNNQDQNEEEFASQYKEFLRRHSNVYPGVNTRVAQAVSNDKVYGNLVLDWDAQTMRKDDANANGDLAMFALPHHQDKLKENVQQDLCTISLLGPLCPILGTSWSMVEMLPEVSFQAPRHPDPSMLPALAEALRTDILYQLPANFQLGAGDTYFSGKALGKLARILLIHEEVNEICQDPSEEYREVCVDALVHMPLELEVTMALEHLRKGVEIWLHGEGQAPFVYDPAWGGVVNCGCMYSYGKCLNQVPNCPAFTDKLLNFGGGFYSDHHFHYGYHIYAAATVGHFDQEWGRQNFEDVLLLVRDFANPSPADASFPLFRHKDWYQGHSWANGISVNFLNGMNQESSSEAIAAYEAVALFGKTMYSIFQDQGDVDKAAAADSIYRAGLVLTATEIRSSQRYYQVTHSNKDKKIYPDVYEPNVVGILWSTMAHYGTWFGNNPYYIYGIQLLPLTPISELRDNVEWSKEMFGPFSKSCDTTCTTSGWSVGVLAILATIGQKEIALEQAQQLSLSVFDTPGGGGHSKSNTLWYIATRPTITDPYSLDDDGSPQINFGEDLTCFQPTTCTDSVLGTMANGYTCRDRMIWLMGATGLSQRGACTAVAVTEYPAQCGGCNPNTDEFTVEIPNDDFPFCNRPSTCTDGVLDSIAEGFSCRARIKWLIDTMQVTRKDACSQVAKQEYPAECGLCDPNGN